MTTITKTVPDPPESEIAVQLDLSVLRYSRVWEDCNVLCKGLDIQPHEDVILSITSSGDNVLNMLLKEPKTIYAVDMSSAQNSLLELKMAAIKTLSHKQFLQLTGDIDYTERLVLYEKIKPLLPDYVQKYWDSNTSMIQTGITESGRLEQYISTLYEHHLPSIVSQEQLDTFFDCSSLQEQREVFSRLPVKEIEDLIAWFASLSNLRKGRSDAQQKYIPKSSEESGREFASRFMSVLENIPPKDNFYMSLFCRGKRGYDPINKPHLAAPYLREENYDKLKGLIDRVTVHTSTLEELLIKLPPSTVTKANLSDIFEYTSIELCHSIFTSLSNAMKTGGRVAYWELLTTRSPPTDQLIFHKELSEKLHNEDRVFYYKSFNIYEIK